jgi:hypothetical protein
VEIPDDTTYRHNCVLAVHTRQQFEYLIFVPRRAARHLNAELNCSLALGSRREPNFSVW